MSESPEYTKNTKEQYEALGRFVEAFENMVHEARVCCTDLLGDGLALKQRRLLAIPLYHQSMTAKPIFDVFRAVLIEALPARTSAKPEDIQYFDKVLAAIQGKYNKLANKRNTLLHGTWHVGYRGPNDEDAATFSLRRWAVSGRGLIGVDTPKTAAEILALVDRCDETRTQISVVHSCFPTKPHSLRIQQCFTFNSDDQMKRVWPSSGTPPPEEC